MQGCGSGSGGRQIFSRELVRWRFFLLLAGTVLTLLTVQAESALAAGFLNTGSMGAARQDHTATLLDDGTVLVTGGTSTASAILGSAEIYNASSATFSATTGAMNAPRQYHTATKLANGKVLIAGGASSGGTTVSSAEIYDPATGNFTLTGPMNSLRRNHTATLLESGKVLITGGRSGSSSSTTLGTAELFDPAANGGVGAFTSTNGPMSIPRAYHTASRLTADGKVLITGGLTTGLVSLASAELYDPIADTFAATGTMLFARNYHAAVVLNDGSVLITGGTSGTSGDPLATAELYDQTLGAFGAGTVAMNAGHSRHTATLLSDGNVLVAGNLSEAGIPGSAAEIFLSGDGGGVFLPIDPMNTTRSNFRAVPLNNGTVLITGGATGSGPTAVAELFSESAVTVTPAGQTFPDTVTGVTSAAQTFTISTNADLAIAPLSITGADSAMFTFSTTCSTQSLPVPDPAPAPSLTAGGSCTVSVTFTPSTTGVKSASLDIATDDPFIPNWSLSLSGTGIPVPPVLLTVATPTGGTVTGTGIACPGVCSESFPNGTEVTLHAEALPGFQFTGWSGACSGTNPDCIIAALIATNANVIANFADITSPVLTLSTLPGGAITNNPILNITGYVTDNNAVQSFTINGNPVTLGAGGSFSYALKLADGANIITSDAVDPAGKKTTDTRTITLDATVPALVVTAPADNSTSNKPFVTVSGTIDLQSTVDISINGGAPQSAAITDTNFTLVVNLVAGLNTLEITATNLAGKKNSLKRSILSGSQYPTINITVPNQDLLTAQAGLTLRGVIADALPPVTVSITSGTDIFTPTVTNGSDFEQALAFLDAKTYPVIIKVTESTGNITTIQRNIVHQLPNGIDPPVTPTKVKTQTVTGTMAAGTTVVVTCPTAGVGTVTYPTTSSWSVLLTGLAEGTNTITAKFNLSGAITTAQSAIVVDSLPPVNGTLVAVAGINQVSLNWTGFVDAVSGIDSYQLVYTTGPSPSSCAAGLLIYSGANTSFVHTGLAKGTTYYYRVCAIDKLANISSGATKSAKLTLSPLVISSVSPLASGTYGVNYSKTLTATGGVKPFVWSVISGELPAGVTLTATNGALRGKPTGWGNFSFTVQVVDKQQNTTTKDLSMTVVVPQLVITTPSLAAGRTGTAYKKVLAAKGGVKPYAWSVVSGTLPGGLTLDAATGIISGKPVAPVTSSLTIQLVDVRNEPVTKVFTLIVK